MNTKENTLSGIVETITEYKPGHYMIEFHLIDSDKSYARTFSDPKLGNYPKWCSLKKGCHVTGLQWYDSSKSLINGDSSVELTEFKPMKINA
jgi:hypothetical protein